jgi:hypothetical protein
MDEKNIKEDAIVCFLLAKTLSEGRTGKVFILEIMLKRYNKRPYKKYDRREIP